MAPAFDPDVFDPGAFDAGAPAPGDKYKLAELPAQYVLAEDNE